MKMKGEEPFPHGSDWKGCSEIVYDPREEFSKFLEEVQENAGEVQRNEVADPAEDRRGSWRNILFFWRKNWKDCRNSGRTVQNLAPALRRLAASGAIPSRTGMCRASRSTSSGPLAGCGAPKRADRSEMQYSSLAKDGPRRSEAEPYGPIYHVT